ncbi:uncharacterized protein LTR77_010469 [Saxophila tyrrhenica]|uniref:Heterokaryon incompatibility domain-containing protein n=1 Tax=Saxophila tyrrhenica TaxID=1690608 RepID=A0AAV9NVG6_9PEZI|nr:hypothetical protein LTR77_010469 [Saxophila tyrrhenica]
MASKYVYDPVDSEHGFCRVLELYLGEFDDDLVIELKDVALEAEDSPRYEALSYTWGTEPATKKVYIKPPGLDALCINQQDIQERGEQVQLMPLIYGYCDHLWVWLGIERDDSSFILEQLRSVSTLEDQERRQVIDGWFGPVYAGRHHRAFKALLGRPWFERTWVQQEIYLAEDATVVCGKETVEWKAFDVTSTAVLDGYIWDPEDAETSWWNSRYDLLYYLRKGPRVIGLRKLLEGTMKTLCSDPRDKVFSVLGMLDQTESRILDALKPDYSIDVAALYKRACVTVLTNQSSLGGLGHLIMLRDCNRIAEATDIPTWVVDWSKPPIEINTIVWQYADAWCSTGEPAVHAESDVLPTRGVICDVISHVQCFEQLHHESAASVLQSIDSHFLNADGKSTRDASLSATVLCITQGQVSEHEGDIGSRFSISALRESFNAIISRSRDPDESRSPNTYGPDEWLTACLVVNLEHRGLSKTASGRMGLTSFHTEVGDVVALLLGLEAVTVLRPQTGGTYKVVGIAFVHGLNWGEGLLGPLPDTK